MTEDWWALVEKASTEPFWDLHRFAATCVTKEYLLSGLM
jgi:hypothetical protein